MAEGEDRSLEVVQRGRALDRIVTSGYNCGFYLIKTLVPVDVTAFYPKPRPFNWAPLDSRSHSLRWLD
jgi:hypothetical protein